MSASVCAERRALALALLLGALVALLLALETARAPDRPECG